ncbi:MAG: TIGR03617 family F420-dependent LLM class oxidoreductase [Cumulibacter sp.]
MPIALEASFAAAKTEPDGTPRYLSHDEIAQRARALEEAGYIGLFTAETNVEPFLPLAIAAGATDRVELGTSIAIELARSPMTTAQVAHQLHGLSRGRFVLGLGSQIRPHITRRFGMPWDRPIARMEAHIDSIQAIWRTWREGTPLQVRNDFFTIDLMPPAFFPPRHEHPDPRIMLAAVGPAMTRLAARKADGIFAHGYTTADYLANVTIPTIENELAAHGRDRSEFRIQGSMLAAMGSTDEELEKATDVLRHRVSFYSSTPSYHRVLAHHGWEDLGHDLHRMSKSDDPLRWDKMADVVPDEVLNAFGIIGTPTQVRDEAQRRFGGLVDRLHGDSLLSSAQ